MKQFIDCDCYLLATIQPISPLAMGLSFSSYGKYVTRLRELATGAVAALSESNRAVYEAALNGEASRELVRLVPLASRRWGGSFFTDTMLADRLAKRLNVQPWTVVADPTVGAGDLLLAAGRSRRLKRTVEETLADWTVGFAGVDRVSDFVAAAKLRLWLLAHVRHGVELNGLPPRTWMPQLQEGNVFDYAGTIEAADEIMLNPPFARIRAPAWYEHGEGKVNAAALITEFAVDHMKPGARMHVILPEVLRTGSLYRRWRTAVASRCRISDVVSCGLFANADVDVFVATLEREGAIVVTKNSGWPKVKVAATTLAHKFHVSVGSVVDYRDPEKGPRRAFIHPRNVKPWTEVSRIGETRRFSGPMVKPPFVVLRRTSRPGDRWRACATLILGQRSVAVENHLIVCRPKLHTKTDCRRLLVQLQDSRVNRFLNREMRCRHLTVEVVRQIPWQTD